MRRVINLAMLFTLLFGSIGSTVLSVAAQGATPGPTAAGDSLLAGLGYPEIHVTSDGTTHDFPAEVAAGRYRIVLENTGDVEVDLEIVQLPEGITPDDVNAAFEEAEESPMFVPPDFFYDMTWNGGVWALPGETRDAVLDLPPGEWYVAFSTWDVETGDEVASDETMFTVTGEMPELGEPEGIEIGLIDMDFTVPATFEAGPQIWRVQNNGRQIHHLVMLGVPDGTTEEEVMDLAAMFAAGPPASPEAGASPAAMPALNPEEVTDEYFTLLFSHNQFNLYEVDLEPGTYAMVCFMPDPSGTPHVMLGMVEIVVVE
jgi:hypothetical protein